MKSFEMLNALIPSDTNLSIVKDPFNHEYEGFTFTYLEETYKSRLAKKTPTKAGYFVVAWIKDDSNNNIPYHADVFSDYLIIFISDENHKGYFKFPKSILIEKGILQSHSHKGKMGFRVYTPWDENLNKTATNTYKWQSRYLYNLMISL